MKKRFFVSILLACALTISFALSACDPSDKNNTDPNDNITDPNGNVTDPNGNVTDPNGNVTDPDKNPSISDVAEELKGALAQLLTEGNVTEEIQIFVAHYTDFTFKDGKYTCAEIASVNGFTCKNIEITLEDKKISKVTYELRTESKDTPDCSVTIDKDGVTRKDIPKPADDKPMDEDEWKEQADVFADVTNYTLERVRVESGDYVASMKLDGTTYYEDINLASSIYDIENGKYYRYHRAPSTTEWVKTEVDERKYTNVVGTPSRMVTVAAQAVQENFSAFTFEGGVYTAEKVTVNYYGEIILRDMQITVRDGKIARVVCVLVGGYDAGGDERITVDQIGSTEIEFPEEYTDETVSTPESSWKEQFSSENFTLKFWEVGNESDVRNILMDGDNFEANQSNFDYKMRFLLEDGIYRTYMYFGGQWIKQPKDFSSGDKEAALWYKSLFSIFTDDFQSFTYEEGKYTCAELKKTILNIEQELVECVFSGIEVKFDEKGQLVSVKYTMKDSEGDIGIEITNIGTTVVNVPDNYVEAGK